MCTFSEDYHPYAAGKSRASTRYLARIGAFPRVTAEVHLQIARAMVRFGAKRTAVGFCSGVYRLVPLPVRVLAELLRAVLALEWLLARV